MTKKQKLIIFLLLIIAILIIPNISEATYQSVPSGTRAVNTTCKNFMINARSIEKDGMGLNEEINNSTLLSTTENNNIDAHFQKNTEYGAAILLGASNYGKRSAWRNSKIYEYNNIRSCNVNRKCIWII